MAYKSIELDEDDLDSMLDDDVELEVEDIEVDSSDSAEDGNAGTKKPYDHDRQSRFQKKINKEVAKRKSAEEEAAALKARLKELETAQLENQKQSVAVFKTQAERTLEGLREQLTSAIDNGDSRKQADLNIEIARVTNQLDRAASWKPTPAPQERETQAAPSDGVSEVAKRNLGAFVSKHQRNLEDPKFKDALDRVAAAVEGEGWDYEDPDTFAEIELRLEKALGKKVGSPVTRRSVDSGGGLNSDLKTLKVSKKDIEYAKDTYGLSQDEYISYLKKSRKRNDMGYTVLDIPGRK